MNAQYFMHDVKQFTTAKRTMQTQLTSAFAVISDFTTSIKPLPEAA